MWRPDADTHINKVSSQITNVDMNQPKYLRWLFAVRLWKSLILATLLINIDETCINYKIKTNYSWTQRVRPREFKARLFSRLINMIFAKVLMEPDYEPSRMGKQTPIFFKTFGHLWWGGLMIINILAIMKR